MTGKQSRLETGLSTASLLFMTLGCLMAPTAGLAGDGFADLGPHEALQAAHFEDSSRRAGPRLPPDGPMESSMPVGSEAGPSQVWQLRYNRGARSDRPEDLVVGPDKSVHLTGRSRIIGTSLSQMITIKIRPNGTARWRKRLSIPGGFVQGQALAVDSAGSTYVAAAAAASGGFFRYVVVKYAPAGRREWKKDLSAEQLGGLGNAIAEDIVVDAFDNIYVTGRLASAESGSGYDGLTLKFDPLGNELWRERYSGGFSGSQQPRMMAVSPDGNVVIAGTGPGSDGHSDFETLKYSPEGLLLWAKRTSGAPSQTDVPEALVVADDGNIHVAGRRGRNSSKSPFATFLALDTLSSAGGTKWKRKHQGREHEAGAFSVDVDADGSVFVAGTTLDGPLESGSPFFDFVTAKYSSTGRLRWKRKWSSSPSFFTDFVAEVRATDDGGAIIVGQGYVSPQNYEYVLIRYSAAGDIVWTHKAGTGRRDLARAMELDEDGGIYVTGTSDNGNNDDILTVKLQQ